jgi:type IX secretion system PorP/SprF family membrane protein
MEINRACLAQAGEAQSISTLFPLYFLLQKTHMKKISTLLLALLLSVGAFAQSRKYMSQFSHLQGYFNPALTAHEGSMVKGFVRNQWAGWDGAPRMNFVSVELDFANLGESSELGKNAVGANLLSDEYGAFSETELILSYATRVHLGEETNLRLGAGVNFNSIRLDGSRLTTEQANDPILGQYLGGFTDMNIVDLNLGMSVIHPNYYASYAVHNINQGSISGGDVFMDKKPRVGIAQAGYRNRFSENMTVITNAMWRTQSDLPATVEFNMKVLFKDKFWVGGGHRVDYANNAQLGVLLGKLRFGYVYEWPMLKSYLIPNQTHEFMLSYRLFGGNTSIW